MKERNPVHAGAFYPYDRKALDKLLNTLFENAKQTDFQNIYTGIVPHAGIVYSGLTASYFYKSIQNKTFQRIVIIGPSHYKLFDGFALSGADKWLLPDGYLELDREFIDSIIDDKISIYELPHSKEHSIEVQMPFIHKIFGSSIKIVPVIMGRQTFSSVEYFIEKMKSMDINNTLFIASSDLYHGYDYEEAKSVDSKTIKEILMENEKGYMEYFDEMERENIPPSCGGGPIAIIIGITKLFNARLHLLHHITSADITGDFNNYTVGYASFIGVK